MNSPQQPVYGRTVVISQATRIWFAVMRRTHGAIHKGKTVHGLWAHERTALETQIQDWCENNGIPLRDVIIHSGYITEPSCYQPFLTEGQRGDLS